MKSLFNKLSILAAMSFFFACEKVENKVYSEGGTAPVLTASTTAVNLQPGIETSTALKLNWTNPEYKFSNGISSLDVSYALEIDTLGGNFKSSNKYTKSFAKDLGFTFTVDELNTIMGNIMLLQIDPRRNYTFQARIIANLGSASVLPLISNVITFTASPFSPPPLVTPPSSGTLYLVGGTSIMGGSSWDNSNPFKPGYQFTKVSATLYTLTVNLAGGDNTKDVNQFLFVPVAGDWGHKYSCSKTSTQPTSGGSFGLDLSDNFPGPASAGTYKITVNFQLGTYSVVKQ